MKDFRFVSFRFWARTTTGVTMLIPIPTMFTFIPPDLYHGRVLDTLVSFFASLGGGGDDDDLVNGAILFNIPWWSETCAGTVGQYVSAIRLIRFLSNSLSTITTILNVECKVIGQDSIISDETKNSQLSNVILDDEFGQSITVIKRTDGDNLLLCSKTSSALEKEWGQENWRKVRQK